MEAVSDKWRVKYRILHVGVMSIDVGVHKQVEDERGHKLQRHLTLLGACMGGRGRETRDGYCREEK